MDVVVKTFVKRAVFRRQERDGFTEEERNVDFKDSGKCRPDAGLRIN
jgi:hypothetical protein